MRDLLESRVKLLNVIRALDRAPWAGWVEAVRPHVRRMEGYLEVVSSEFRRGYKDISGAQRIYEASVKVTLDKVSPMEGQNVRLPENVPWMNLKTLEALQDLLADGSEEPGGKSGYAVKFVESFDQASAHLRDALKSLWAQPAAPRRGVMG